MKSNSPLAVAAEITKNEETEQSAVSSGQLATDAASQLIRANRYAVSLFSGARDVLLDEMIFVGKEVFERVVAETTIFNAFLAKLEEAHSVRDYGAVCQECTKHQLEFIRRDMERVLKHSERAIDNTAKLVETWRSNGASSAFEQVRAQE
ncbi:hypothetical protein [Bradyrhizobium sp. USDA 10063]